jgi:hypothetical protein
LPPIAYLPISAHWTVSEQTAAFLKCRSLDFEGGGGVSGFKDAEIPLGPECSWSAVSTATAVAHTARTATAITT